MSQRANPALIGGFVVAAVALAVAVVLLFGSGQLFTRQPKYVAFFEGSLFGLNVGAPVAFRGVRVGSVTDVSALLYTRGDDGMPTIRIQVTMEMSRNPVEIRDQSLLQRQTRETLIDTLIEDRDMRAKLAMQSIVTGLLYIELDFFPGSESVFLDIETPYPQLPTIQSGLQRFTQSLQALPFDEIAHKAVDLLDGLDEIVRSPQIQDIISNAGTTLLDLQRLTGNLDTHLAPLAEALRVAAEAATKALRQAELTLALNEGVPGKLAVDVATAAEATTAALVQAEQTLAAAEDVLGARSPLQARTIKLLNELTAAARSLRILADFLQRHPEALLRGKRR